MGKPAALLLVLVFLTASCIVAFLPVKAESRTIVVPDDYPTISLAIQNAGVGDTVFVKRGTYDEVAININKSISLIGEDVDETILSLNPPLVETWIFYNVIWVPDTTIKINANGVKLQGFTINLPNDDYGVGSGIYAVGDEISFTDNIVANRSVYLRGSVLNIAGNLIPSALEVVGSNLTIANNTIKHTLKIQGSFNLIYTNKIVSGYYSDDIYLNGSFNCVVGNSFSSMEMADCNSNFIIGNSFVNLDLEEFGKGGCSDNIISKNRVDGNRRINDGIWLWYGEDNIISANSIRNCENGLLLGTTGKTAVENSIYLNNFVNNTNQVVSLSGSNHTVNHFDNGVKGNYYDDYHGNDANGDGVGDLPYTIQVTRWEEELKSDVTIVFFQDNYPLMSPFDIDGFSVEFPEWASSALSTSPAPKTSEPPVALLIAAAALLAIIYAGLLVYFKKHKTL
jgi:nitrous oxidase accessory protein